MKRGLITFGIDLDRKDQIDGLIADFLAKFPGAEQYSQDKERGQFQLILAPGVSYKISELEEYQSWRRRWQVKLIIEGAYIRWGRPEHVLPHNMKCLREDVCIKMAQNAIGPDTFFPKQTLYLRSWSDEQAIFYDDTGQLHLAAYVYIPDRALSYWHEICPLSRETDILDWMGLKHED